MEDRSWHSDPMFTSYNAPSFSAYEDSDGILDFHDIISAEELNKENLDDRVDGKKSKAEREKLLARRTVTGVFNATPTSPTASPPPRPATWTKNVSSWSLSGSGRKESLSAKKKFMSTKEYNENLAKYQKENLELKIKCHLLQERLGASDDSDTPCSGSSCVDVQVQMKILEKKVWILSDMLREKDEALRQKDEELSSLTQPSFMKHIQEDELEQARLQGYMQAKEEMAVPDVTLRDSAVQTSLLLDDCMQSANLPADGAEVEKTMEANTTEYRDFPLVHSGRPSLQSARKISAAPVSPLTPSKARVGLVERNTFHMLIKHLQDIVTFLTNGLNGQFDLSNTSINVSQAYLLETTSLDISLMADVGSGDGSNVSFSLASKLQEVLEVSRELSSSLGVDTDDVDSNWSALKAEKEGLVARVESLTRQLEDAGTQLHSALGDKERLRDEFALTQQSLAMQMDVLKADNDKLIQKLSLVEADKAVLESEMRDLMKDISAFEDEMLNTKAQQQMLVERLQARPDMDMSSQTDFTAADIDALSRAVQQKEENMAALTAQLESSQDARRELESRLQETCGLMEALENDKRDMAVDLEAVQQEVTGLKALVEQLEMDGQLVAMSLDLMKGDRDHIAAEYRTFRASQEVESEELHSTVARLEGEVQSGLSIRGALQDSLHAAGDEINTLKMRLEELHVELHKAQDAHAVVERMLLEKCPPVASLALQTDLSWDSVKAEKNHFLDTIEKLVDEVETLQGHLETVKRSTAVALDRKTNETMSVTDKLETVTTELESMFDIKNELEKRVVALTEALSELEGRLLQMEEERNGLAADKENLSGQLVRWQKAVTKQVGKSQEIIKVANRNLAESARAHARPPPASQNPLREKHTAPGGQQQH